MKEFLSSAGELIVDVFWDNSITTVPITISIVAIIISIAAANKQNRIALFELRYRCYSQLRTIRAFDASIYDCKDAKVILKMFDALWGTNLANIPDEESLLQARCHMEEIVHDVLQREFLFKHKFQTDFVDIVKYTQRILVDATSGIINEDAQEELHRLCELYEKKDLSYMCKKLKI